MLRCCGVQPRDVAAVEQHRALRRRDEAGDDVEQRRLAAARGPEQRVGAAVLEGHLQRQQRVVLVALRVRRCRRARGRGRCGPCQCSARRRVGRDAAGRRRRRTRRPAPGSRYSVIGCAERELVHAGAAARPARRPACRRARRCRSRRSRPARRVPGSASVAVAPRARAVRWRGCRPSAPRRRRWPAGSGSGSISPPGSATPFGRGLAGDQVHRRVAEGARDADRLRPVEDLGRRPVLQQLAGVQHRGVAAEQQRLGRLGGGVDDGGLAGWRTAARAPRAAPRAACSRG